MTTADERHARDQVRGALETITPSPVPAGAVIARGKALRTRRRITIAAGVTAGLAVAAAAAGLGPGLLHQLIHPQLAQHPHSKRLVSVHPPGAGGPPGEIAWGRVNGRHWQITLSRSGLITAADSPNKVGPLRADSMDPFNFTEARNILGDAYVGAVHRNVSLVTVRLGNGEVLRLHPVTVFGYRLAGFESARGLPVARITAYAGNRELAYAIPYYGSGYAKWGQLLRPGQAVPARVSRVLFSGLVLGANLRVTVHIGPWGRCLYADIGSGPDGVCSPLADNSGGGVTVESRGPGQPGLVSGALGTHVASLMLTTADGRSISVRLVPVVGLKYYAFILTRLPRIVSWATFDAAGNLLSTGQGAP